MRIAERTDDFIHQIQYGDITLVSWGGSGGTMLFPNYARLTQSAVIPVSSGGSLYNQVLSLNSGTTYYAADDGYLRASLKNVTGGGCLRLAVNGSTIGLFDAHSGGPGSTHSYPIPKGAAFSVSFEGTGDLLIKFDHDVSLTSI